MLWHALFLGIYIKCGPYSTWNELSVETWAFSYELKSHLCSKGRCVMCVFFQLLRFFTSVLSISVCSTSSEFHLIALEFLLSFTAIFFLLEFWGIVLLLSLCFAVLSWPLFLLLLKLMFPFATHRWGWCPYLPVSPLTPFFPCCWAQKILEWKGRWASKLINDNLITFLPAWNSQTMNFAPVYQPNLNPIGRF